MIDVHCHYLPGVDDGARDVQESIALLRLAALDGARQIVVTPHVYPGRWDNDIHSLRPLLAELRSKVKENEIGVELFLGGEVRLLPESLALVATGKAPFVGGWQGSKVLLLELEDARIPVGALNAVRYLRRMGVICMIAHPERNRAVMLDPRVMEPFVEEGCLLQLTAASVVGRFGDRAKIAAHELLARGWVTFVASDAHNVLHRPPMLTAARDEIASAYGSELALSLMVDAPARLISGRRDLNIDESP